MDSWIKKAAKDTKRQITIVIDPHYVDYCGRGCPFLGKFFPAKCGLFDSDLRTVALEGHEKESLYVRDQRCIENFK